MMNNIAILILAAGASSRMKEPKQLLKVNGKSLLEIVIDNAKASKVNNIFCVLGAHEKLINKIIVDKNIKVIYHPTYEQGLSSSIKKGIESLEKHCPSLAAILILLADQPKVNSSYINQFIEEHFNDSSKIIASTYGTTPGVPALFPKCYFDDLKQLSGDKGARLFLQQEQQHVILLPENERLMDIDTPEDFQKFLKNN